MRRLWTTLPDSIFIELEKLATEEDRPVSNLVAFVIEKHVREERAAKREEAALFRR